MRAPAQVVLPYYYLTCANGSDARRVCLPIWLAAVQHLNPLFLHLPKKRLALSAYLVLQYKHLTPTIFAIHAHCTTWRSHQRCRHTLADSEQSAPTHTHKHNTFRSKSILKARPPQEANATCTHSIAHPVVWLFIELLNGIHTLPLSAFCFVLILQ